MFQGDSYRAWVALALVAVVLLALGHDASNTSGSPGSGRAERDQVEGHPSRPACDRALTRLGGAAGSVDFAVHCGPLHGGETVAFEVAVGESGRPTIKAFRRRLLVVMGSGDHRHGSCRRGSRRPAASLICQASVDGAPTVRGRIWVGGADACDVNVAVISRSKPKPCDRACATDYVAGLPILAEGPPRGC